MARPTRARLRSRCPGLVPALANTKMQMMETERGAENPFVRPAVACLCPVWKFVSSHFRWLQGALGNDAKCDRARAPVRRFSSAKNLSEKFMHNLTQNAEDENAERAKSMKFALTKCSVFIPNITRKCTAKCVRLHPRRQKSYGGRGAPLVRRKAAALGQAHAEYWNHIRFDAHMRRTNNTRRKLISVVALPPRLPVFRSFSGQLGGNGVIKATACPKIRSGALRPPYGGPGLRTEQMSRISRKISTFLRMTYGVQHFAKTRHSCRETEFMPHAHSCTRARGQLFHIITRAIEQHKCASSLPAL